MTADPAFASPAFACPHCGETERIEEVNKRTVMLTVTAWHPDGTPAAYGGERDILEEISAEGGFYCRGCEREFPAPVPAPARPR